MGINNSELRIIAIITVVLLFGGIGSIQESFAITADEIKEKLKIDDFTTKPTFGLSHENKKIIDKGFTFNNKTYTVTNNFHTPFPEQPVTIGEVNSFAAKVYADHGLRVQEFLFGIPIKGDAHLAELGVEVWYGLFGEIQKVNVVQKSNVVEIDSVIATHEKAKCASKDIEEKCDVTNISMVFLEPLQNKVMAIKAIDNKNRYQITYLNEGLDISGASLNHMPTVMISSPVRNEGLIELTQTEKYSNFWIAKDERMFEKNDFGSFKQINRSFERFQDSGEPRSRVHSGFGGILAYEQERATSLFDANELVSNLPDYVTYATPKVSERITQDLNTKMIKEEQKCQKILEESNVQARW